MPTAGCAARSSRGRWGWRRTKSENSNLLLTPCWDGASSSQIYILKLLSLRFRYVTGLYGADHAPEMTMMPASSGDLASTDGTSIEPRGFDG
jgi:hypothetical protein